MTADMRQSQQFQELMRKFGHTVEDLGGGQVSYIMRMKFFSRVNILVILRAEDPIVLSAADKISRRYHSLIVKVAPRIHLGGQEASLWEKELRQHKYSLDKSPVAPTKTLILDLGQSESDLLGQMKPKTRYNIGLSKRRGVTAQVIDGSDFETNGTYFDEFYTVYCENCRRIGTNSLPRAWLEMSAKAFQKDLYVVLTRINNSEVAAVNSFVVTGDTVTYLINGSTEKGRHDFATNLAVWEGMLEGKRRGCKWFDFDGVHDERFKRTEEWEGFTRFKAGFGGEEITYLGSYGKWLPFLRK